MAHDENAKRGPEQQDSPGRQDAHTKADSLRNGGFLVGRILVGLFYLLTGSNHFLELDGMTSAASGAGVPLPMVAVLGTGLLLIAAGITILLGLKPRWGVLALVVFFLPVTFTMHAFWSVPEAQAQAQMTHFLKNMALMGSGLTLLAIPQPWPISVDAKLHQRSAETAAEAEGKLGRKQKPEHREVPSEG